MSFDNILMVYRQGYMGSGKNKYKNLIGFIITFLLMSTLMFYFRLPLINTEKIAFGVMFIYIYKTYIYMKSIVSSNKASLFAVLPFSNSELFTAYFSRILIENFKKYIILFIVPAYIYFLTSGLITSIDMIKDLCQLLIISICSILIGFLMYILLNSKKYIFSIVFFVIYSFLINNTFYKNLVFSSIVLVGLFTFTVIFFRKYFKAYGANKSIHIINNIGLFRREIVRFFNDKVLIINHVVTSIFAVVFLLNLNLRYSDVPIEMSYFLFFMLSIMSTSSILFSLEKDNRLIIQSLPLDTRVLFLYKYLFLSIITLPNYIVTFLIISIFGLKLEFLTMISIILANELSIFIRLYIDYKSPYFKYDNTKQLLENKRKYFSFISLIIMFLPLVLINKVPIYLLITIQIIVFILVVLIVKKILIKGRRS